MPIQVVCPSCFKRFQVSEKFAGKSGPCPSCKKTIKVPEKSEEVVVHAPDDGAPKDRQGQSVLKPIKRKETDVTRKGLLLTVAAVVTALVLALVVRFVFATVPWWMLIVAAVLLAPPIIWAGYTFVRDSELDPYTGTDLRNRVLIASALFPLLWLVYALVPSYLNDYDRPSEMTFLWFGISLAAMLGIGGAISAATFELEYFSGLIHAGFYVTITLLLAVLAGVPLVGQEPAEEVVQRTSQPPELATTALRSSGKRIRECSWRNSNAKFPWSSDWFIDTRRAAIAESPSC